MYSLRNSPLDGKNVRRAHQSHTHLVPKQSVGLDSSCMDQTALLSQLGLEQSLWTYSLGGRGRHLCGSGFKRARFDLMNKISG